MERNGIEHGAGCIEVKTEDRNQKAEIRRQKTEDRRQRTEDRRQRTDDRKLNVEVGRIGMRNAERKSIDHGAGRVEIKTEDRLQNADFGWQNNLYQQITH